MKQTKTANKNKTPAVVSTTPHVVNNNSSDFINQSSKEYAIYTAQNRAIPSSCDGLKDGQRKMLWIIRNKSEKIKTVSLAGSAIQEGIFLHGDSSASETISRLAAPYLNNRPLLEGIGAFGTRVAPDGWGAPRYTYVKRNKITEALVYPDLDIVPLKPNYDGSVLEPANFLPLIPLVLLNGISGIAVGWSTEILPHSLRSIVAATAAAIDGKPIPELIPSFDNMTVGVNKLAENSYEFTGRVEIEGDSLVRVTELPPDLSLERFKTRLNQLEDEDQIHSYTDRSTKTINIEIRFKRGTVKSWTEQDAINWLKLKSKTTQRLVVLDFNNSSIRQYDNTADLIKAFVQWRLGYYTVRFNKEIESLRRDLAFAQAVKACVAARLPQWLPTARTKQDVEQKVRIITKGIPLDDIQLERIVGFPSYRWAQDSIARIDEEIASLTTKIGELEALLNNPQAIRAVYKREVQALAAL